MVTPRWPGLPQAHRIVIVGMETWKHIRAILLLPVIATVVIPGVLLYFFGVDSLGLWQSSQITLHHSPVPLGRSGISFQQRLVLLLGQSVQSDTSRLSSSGRDVNGKITL